jgi:hypothetical protein
MIENEGAVAPLTLKIKDEGAARPPVDQEIDLDMEAKAEMRNRMTIWHLSSAATIYDVTLWEET